MEVTSNKRIMKNTLFLYLRMGIIMLVTLYTSRIVLLRLGIENYGVYMVVGGVVAMLGFLNASMVTSTQRYLNYEMGNEKSTLESLKRVFSTSLRIHLIIILCVLILAETIGLWFVNYKLVVPEGSRIGAQIVYQTSILVFCISIFQSPFNAAIIAHEKMHFYAIISILEAGLRLGVAFALGLFLNYRLAAYGVMLLAVQAMVATSYITVCIRKFPECGFSLNHDGKLSKEMASFAGWNMFGSIAWLVRSQGLGIILNIFFGPVLNAAKGVADQVSHAVSSLNSNFQVALNPQITKNYAAHRLQEMELLTYRGIKFSALLQWLIALPIMICVNTILSIWLKDVPEYAPIFVILILIDGLASTLFGSPLMTSMAATGKIRTYQIIVSLILLLILPASYIALKLGMPPVTVFYFNILFNLLAGITRFIFCKNAIGYSFTYYLRYVGLPLSLVFILSPILPLVFRYFHLLPENEYISFGLLFILTFCCSCGFSWWIGFTQIEREKIKTLVLNKFLRHGKNL
ncbi:MAG: lipopolysaccharide biosynthesis protein [Bacteroides sp.]|nr:lipopolysaccharide biosynthesis protein [Bacteroides sp.]